MVSCERSAYILTRKKKMVLFLSYRESKLEEITNLLGYWQMGSCSGNYTENVHHVHDTNRSREPTADARNRFLTPHTDFFYTIQK